MQVVEPVWGSKEYIKYLVLVNTASGVSTFFVIYLAYAMDRNNEGNLLCAPSNQDLLAGCHHSQMSLLDAQSDEFVLRIENVSLAQVC